MRLSWARSRGGTAFPSSWTPARRALALPRGPAASRAAARRAAPGRELGVSGSLLSDAAWSVHSKPAWSMHSQPRRRQRVWFPGRAGPWGVNRGRCERKQRSGLGACCTVSAPARKRGAARARRAWASCRWMCARSAATGSPARRASSCAGRAALASCTRPGADQTLSG